MDSIVMCFGNPGWIYQRSECNKEIEIINSPIAQKPCSLHPRNEQGFSSVLGMRLRVKTVVNGI